MVLSTHQTEDVAALCHQVVVIHQGRASIHRHAHRADRTAAGRVWLDRTQRAPSARRRGAPPRATSATSASRPPGARSVPPTLEDAYLLLVGEGAAKEVAA